MNDSQRQQTIHCYNSSGIEVPLPVGADPYEIPTPGSHYFLNDEGIYSFVSGPNN